MRTTLDHDNQAPRNFTARGRASSGRVRYPELASLNRFELFNFRIFAATLGVADLFPGRFAPALRPKGRQFLVSGFFVSTVALLHRTFFRDSLMPALDTLAEGWHNNDHRSMTAARRGFSWREIDETYHLLNPLSWTRLNWELKTVPSSLYEEATRRLETAT